MRRKRTPTGFLTRKQGSKRLGRRDPRIGKPFPIFPRYDAAARRIERAGSAFTRALHKASPAKIGQFHGTPFSHGRERTPIVADGALRAVEQLHKRIVKAKIKASGGTMHDIDQAIRILEQELGIRRRGVGAAVFGPRVHPSTVLRTDPFFIETRQRVINARYAWNRANAAALVERRQLIQDEAAREILDIAIPTPAEVRIRYPLVPGRRTAEEMQKIRLQEKLAVTRAKARAIKGWEKLKARIQEIKELPPKKLRELIVPPPGPAERKISWRRKAAAKRFREKVAKKEFPPATPEEERMIAEAEKTAAMARRVLSKERTEKWTERAKVKAEEGKGWLKGKVDELKKVPPWIAARADELKKALETEEPEEEEPGGIFAVE